MDLQTTLKPAVHIAGKTGEVVIPTADQLEIHVQADNAAVAMTVDNNRLDAIHHLDTIIYSAL